MVDLTDGRSIVYIGYMFLCRNIGRMRLIKEFRAEHSQHKMRTYWRKIGFVTAEQEARLLKWLPRIGLPKDKTLAEAGLPEAAPVVLEIGFGNGGFLVHLSKLFRKIFLLFWRAGQRRAPGPGWRRRKEIAGRGWNPPQP